MKILYILIAISMFLSCSPKKEEFKGDLTIGGEPIEMHDKQLKAGGDEK